MSLRIRFCSRWDTTCGGAKSFTTEGTEVHGGRESDPTGERLTDREDRRYFFSAFLEDDSDFGLSSFLLLSDLVPESDEPVDAGAPDFLA